MSSGNKEEVVLQNLELGSSDRSWTLAGLQEVATRRNEADPGDNAQGSLINLPSVPPIGHIQQKPAGRDLWENIL